MQSLPSIEVGEALRARLAQASDGDELRCTLCLKQDTADSVLGGASIGGKVHFAERDLRIMVSKLKSVLQSSMGIEVIEDRSLPVTPVIEGGVLVAFACGTLEVAAPAGQLKRLIGGIDKKVPAIVRNMVLGLN